MSWQGYIDKTLVGSGKVDTAAIIARDGSSTWALSPGFNVSAEESQTLAKAFDDSSSLFSTGIIINGVKYFLLRADERSIYGKLDTSGIIAVRTQQTIVVGHYGESTQPGEAVKVMEQLGDYLLGVGY